MKKAIIFALLTLAIISLAGYFFLKHSQQGTSGEELYYVGEDGKFYIFNTSNNTKTQFTATLPETANVGSLTFSPNGRHLLFIDHENPLAAPDDSVLYEYDFKTKKTTKLYSGENRFSPYFSSDGKYATVYIGTYVGESKVALIDLDSKEVIFDGFGSVQLSPDSKKYALEQGVLDLNNSTGEHELIRSIYITPVREEMIAYTNAPTQGDYGTSYELVKWIDNDTFVYQQTIFEPSFLAKDQHSKTSGDYEYWNKVYDNGQKSYFSINVKTLVKTPVQKPITPEYDYNAELLSPLKDWKIVRENDEEIDSPTISYAVRLSDNFRIKLGGYAIAWRPLK